MVVKSKKRSRDQLEAGLQDEESKIFLKLDDSNLSHSKFVKPKEIEDELHFISNLVIG